MRVIYIDVFFIYNFLIDCFLLYLSAKVMKAETNYRIAISGIVGSLYSVLCLFDNMFYLSFILVRLFVLIIMIFIAFTRKIVFALKIMGCYLLFSFLFGGIMFYMLKDDFKILNGNVYFINSFLISFVCAVITLFFAVIFVRLIVKKFRLSNLYKTIYITANKKRKKLYAMVDTGNSVRDFHFNLPVIFINSGLIDFNGLETHIIKVYTATGTSGILCALPEKIEIDNKEVKAVVGIAREKIVGCDCLISCDLIKEE